MFRLSRENFLTEDKRLIEQFYFEGYSIHDICSVLNLEYYEVLYYVGNIIKSQDFMSNHAFCKEFYDDKLLAVSDTHLGSKFENMDYIYETYQYAFNNYFKSVLHLGDVIQSTYKPVLKMYNTFESQVVHLINDYPKMNGITTYFVLGNHDFHTFSNNRELLDMVQEREDFKILGFSKAYIYYKNVPILLSHWCPKYNFEIPNAEAFFTIKGHSHFLSIRDNTISVPSNSDDMKNNGIPGFLVLDQDESFLNIYSKEFVDTEIVDGKKYSLKKI